MLLHGFENHTRYRIKAGKYAGEGEHKGCHDLWNAFQLQGYAQT
jgi:hypothetical protein